MDEEKEIHSTIKKPLKYLMQHFCLHIIFTTQSLLRQYFVLNTGENNKYLSAFIRCARDQTCKTPNTQGVKETANILSRRC